MMASSGSIGRTISVMEMRAMRQPTKSDVPNEEVYPTQPIPHTKRNVPQSPLCAIFPPNIDDPALVARARPMFTPPSAKEPMLISPGAFGGTNRAPAAFSPRTGLFYIPSWMDTFSTYFKAPVEYKEGNQYVGRFPTMAFPALRTGPGAINQRLPEDGYGAIQAFDTKDLPCKVAGQVPSGVKAEHGLDLAAMARRYAIDEAHAADDGFPCCTFKGAVFGLDTRTGRILWKTSTQPPDPGYSGGGVWGHAPVVDDTRGLVYVGTGNSFRLPDAVMECIRNAVALGSTREAAGMSCDPKFNQNHFDSILALRQNTGAIVWNSPKNSAMSWKKSFLKSLKRTGPSGRHVNRPSGVTRAATTRCWSSAAVPRWG